MFAYPQVFYFILLTRFSRNVLPLCNGYHEFLARLERGPQTFLIRILNVDEGPRVSMLAQWVILDSIQIRKICRTVGESHESTLRRWDRNTRSTGLVFAIRSWTAVRRAVNTVGNVFVRAEVSTRSTQYA